MELTELMHENSRPSCSPWHRSKKQLALRDLAGTEAKRQDAKEGDLW